MVNAELCPDSGKRAFLPNADEVEVAVRYRHEAPFNLFSTAIFNSLAFLIAVTPSPL